jgi:Flp pilus assembly protein CpaB
VNWRQGRFPWIPLAVAIALLALLAFRIVYRIESGRPRVVVAAAELARDVELTPQSIAMAKAPRNIKHNGFLMAPEQALGRTLLIPKKAGEPIFASDLKKNGEKPALSSIIPEGRVLTSLMLRNPVIPLRDLQRGDRLDVIASGKPEAGIREARVVAKDAYVVGFARPDQKREENGQSKDMLGISIKPPAQSRSEQPVYEILILAVEPRAVMPLASVGGSEYVITLVLHGREEVRRGVYHDVAFHPQGRKVEVIAGAVRQVVTVP